MDGAAQGRRSDGGRAAAGGPSSWAAAGSSAQAADAVTEAGPRRAMLAVVGMALLLAAVLAASVGLTPTGGPAPFDGSAPARPVPAARPPAPEAAPPATRRPALAPASTSSSPVTPPAPADSAPTVATPAPSGEASASGHRLTPADAVQPGDSAAAPVVDDPLDDGDEGELDDAYDLAALEGPVVDAPPEVVAAAAALASGVAVAPVAAVEAAAVTPTPAPTTPTTTRPTTPPVVTPNPSPTLRPGVHPAAPDFPSWIEPTISYEAENVCDPVAKPGALQLQAMLKATYGDEISSNIVRACSSKNTGHKAGRALDWMVNSRNSAQAAMGDAYVAWLLAPDKYGNKFAMARRLGVMYVIWRGRSFGLYSGVWKEYNSCLTKYTAKSDDNTCHRNHVHTSLTWAGARQQTTWWTLAHGLPWCTAPTTPVWTHAGATGVAATLTQTRVFDSAAGRGTPVPPLPCRTAANSLLALRGMGVAGLPRTGVGKVQVRVSARGLGTASTVAVVGPPVVARRTGAPATSLAVPASATVTGTLWLPVNVNGFVYLRVGAAPVNLVVDVLGYAPLAPPVTVHAARTPTRRSVPHPSPVRTAHR